MAACREETLLDLLNIGTQYVALPRAANEPLGMTELIQGNVGMLLWKE